MKRIFLLTLVFFTTHAMAQFSLKPHVGLNFSQLSDTPEQLKDEARVGFVAGVGFKIGARVYFEPSLQYAAFGTKLVSRDDQDVSHQSYVKTLRIPAVVGFHLFDEDSFINVRAFTGPSVAFVFAVDHESSTQLALDKEDYASSIWGWNFGLGADVWFLYLELGYELGLTNYYSTSVIDHKDAKNNVFTITIGADLF